MFHFQPRHLEIPGTARVYCFSDVHSNLKITKAHCTAINKDLGEHPPQKGQPVYIVNLGDTIDKGPDTRKTIKLMIQMRKRGKQSGQYKFIALWGNHELELFQFLQGPAPNRVHEWYNHQIRWIMVGGGIDTLASYGAVPTDIYATYLTAKEQSTHRNFVKREDSKTAVRECEDYIRTHLDDIAEQMAKRLRDTKHTKFFRRLYLSATMEIGSRKIFFSHAGGDPHKPLEKQTINDLTRSRIITRAFEGAKKTIASPVLYVHGHSQSTQIPDSHPNRVGLDIGGHKTDQSIVGVFENTTTRFLLPSSILS